MRNTHGGLRGLMVAVRRLPGLFSLLAVLAAAGLTRPLAAQGTQLPLSGPSTLELNKLRLVQPSALVLLGSSAAVEHPGSVQELGFTLLSSAKQTTGIPAGIALESTPALVGKRKLPTEDYYANNLTNILRRLTFSVATATGDSSPGALAPSVSGAVGVRTLLWDSYNAPPERREEADTATARQQRARFRAQQDSIGAGSARAAFTAAETRLAALDAFVVRQTLVVLAADTATAEADRATLRDSLDDAAAIRANLPALRATGDSLAEAARVSASVVDSLVRERRAAISAAFGEDALVGTRVEFALGIRGRFPDGRWSTAAWDGLGVWITPTYRGRNGWQGTLLARVLTRVRDYDDNSVVDLGVRADYNWARLALGIEGVARWVGDSQTESDDIASPAPRHAQRYVGLAEYRLGESIKLTASFGSDFKRQDGTTTGRPVVSTLGLTFGFGSIGVAFPDEPDG